MLSNTHLVSRHCQKCKRTTPQAFSNLRHLGCTKCEPHLLEIRLQGLILVDSATKSSLKIGQVVRLDGQKFYLKGAEGPHHSGSTGRVFIVGSKRALNGPLGIDDRCYFPSVVDAEWMPEGRFAARLKGGR